MSSPLATFSNARILYVSPGARTSGRDGFKELPGQAYLIKCFLKRGPKGDTDKLALPAVDGLLMEFHGYSISFAPVTTEQAANFSTVDENNLAFDSSANLPGEIVRDARGKLFVSGLGIIDIRFVNITSDYGDDGIGETIKAVLGSTIHLEGGQVG